MARKSKKNSGFKIGIYIRVSTEEQAQNIEGSIKNQTERLKAHVEYKNSRENFGEITHTFVDRAKSGKDTNRPELQKLLKAIRSGEINFVLASELSRITRSIKDFASIWELMQKHDCGFQSLRENFDTTTAAGEMVLFSMANLAQFERRQVSERVSLNMNARAKRGLYNGGVIPFGYKRIPGKTGYLDVDKKQATVIKKAFQVFLREESLAKASKWLNEKGYGLERSTEGGGKFRLDLFTTSNLHHILRNKAYIGMRSHQEGEKIVFVKAVWKPIIEKAQFARVQKMLTNNKSRKKTSSPKRYPYLLTGITFCKTCGDHLSGKSAHGRNRKIPYYEHGWRTKKGSSLTQKQFDCGNHRRFNGEKLEAIVLGELEKLITDEDLTKQLIDQANTIHNSQSLPKELEKLKSEIYGFNSQLEALAERLSQLPKSVSAGPIFKQMEKLEGRKKIKSEKVSELNQSKLELVNPPIELKVYQKFLKALKKLIKLRSEIRNLEKACTSRSA